MRESMETMMYNNGVDIVLNGHLHEYERSKSVYVSSSTACLCPLTCSPSPFVNAAASCSPAS